MQARRPRVCIEAESAMAELIPFALDLQLHRAFFEYEREGKIFDLPKEKFYFGSDVDTSVYSNGHRAYTPLGPAAGPHTQLLQNIVLAWLGGARIIELKTVQVLDELRLPRPCIDAATVTYNVEWSQELKLRQSLREYVAAAMFLTILRESKLLGEGLPAEFYETVFDMSAGYSLEGIRSPQVRSWLEGMKDATRVMEELRPTLSGRFRRFRDLEFGARISDTITLSTFHGCPPREIEGIVSFLLQDMGLNVCVKMNPTLLGRERVEHLLHDVLGYRDIALTDDAFARDMQFDEAVDLTPQLQAKAAACGRRLSLKFSNTLVVRNHRKVFPDEVMYMSGAPLHIITLNLVQRFRERLGASVPLSFSAGMTAQNVAAMVAMNFVPVTTCTDLLKTGGYGRLHKYMANLRSAMREVQAKTIPEFVLRYGGQGRAAIEKVADKVADWSLKAAVDSRLADWLGHPENSLREACAAFNERLPDLEQRLVDAAGVLNTTLLVSRATADPRYRYEQNKTAPRKTGVKLALFDCIACDKCVPVCPNDANFAVEVPEGEIAFHDYELLPDGGFRAAGKRIFTLTKRRQFANFADACNDCGNCDVFCPEEGGPFRVKPRFFGSLQSFHAYAGENGFFLDFDGDVRILHGVIAGRQYKLTLDVSPDCARFEDENGEYVIQRSTAALMSWRTKNAAAPLCFAMLPYVQMKILFDAITDLRHVHYANVAALKGAS